MKPTPEQMRGMGYAADAEPFELSDLAWAAFCAWINVPMAKVPPHMRWKPEQSALAWERVANAVSQRAQHPVAFAE